MCWQKTNSGECTWQKSQALAFIKCAAQIYAAVCTHLTFVSVLISHSLTQPPLLHSRFYSLIKPQARLCIRKPHSCVTIRMLLARGKPEHKRCVGNTCITNDSAAGRHCNSIHLLYCEANAGW